MATFAMVTGVASGIGQAISEQLCKDGFKVLGVDKVPCSWSTANLSTLQCDISAKDIPELIRRRVSEEFGHIDVLVHAAGVCPVLPLEELTYGELDKVLSVNLTAAWEITSACLTLLKQSKQGRIITIGSITSHFSSPGLAAYGTSKHALLGLTKALATELGQYGITANCILPGAIVTNITRKAYENDKNFRDYWINKSAVGRWGEPQDIANLAAFLVSEKASFISGHGIYADGGAMQNA